MPRHLTVSPRPRTRRAAAEASRTPTPAQRPERGGRSASHAHRSANPADRLLDRDGRGVDRQAFAVPGDVITRHHIVPGRQRVTGDVGFPALDAIAMHVTIGTDDLDV